MDKPTLIPLFPLDVVLLPSMPLPLHIFEPRYKEMIAHCLDAKLEFGLAPDGALVLADEVLTPDSSRFWPASQWQPNRPQRSLDKQFLRDWSAGLDWDRKPPGPAIPSDVVAATRARYQELYTRLTGRDA